MKSIAKTLVILVAFTVFVCTSCTKTGNSSSTTPSAGTDSVTMILSAGKWVISSMTELKEDNTQSFKDYVFVFGKDGKLTASKNGASVQGTWHFSPAVTYYGSSSKDAISISIGSDNPFRRLTKTWNLISITSSLMKLENPEIQEQEQVQFQKQ